MIKSRLINIKDTGKRNKCLTESVQLLHYPPHLLATDQRGSDSVELYITREIAGSMFAVIKPNGELH